jgi:hypothetical protein
MLAHTHNGTLCSHEKGRRISTHNYGVINVLLWVEKRRVGKTGKTRFLLSRTSVGNTHRSLKMQWRDKPPTKGTG